MNARIVVLAGEPEYDSQSTMRGVSDEISRELGATAFFRTPNVIGDEPNFPESSFGDLGALDDADLLIMYTRFRNLADADMTRLEQYLASGRPILALRTSTHAFHFPAASRWASWNESFGRDVLGSPWISHHGHTSSTDVSIASGAPDQLVRGLPEHFHVRSWLYVAEPASWCTPILLGRPVASETEVRAGPVAWYGKQGRRPTFYTSLGHADDLVLPPVRRLLVNAAEWAIDASGRVGTN